MLKKRLGTESETSVGENGFDDEWNMDIDEQREKVGSQKEELQKQLRNVNECPDMPQDIREVLKEKWQQKMQNSFQKIAKLAGQEEAVPDGYVQMDWTSWGGQE